MSTANNTYQVFQTPSSGRWQRFKWASRILLLFAALGLTVLIIAIRRGYTPSLPKLKNIAYKKSLDPNQSFISKNSKIAQQYGGFRKYITEKDAYQQSCYNPFKIKTGDGRNDLYSSFMQKDTAFLSFNKFPCGIRAAFYVAWDPQSFYSLQRNISKLNLVIPEWMFIDPRGDSLKIQRDDRALDVMKRSQVKIMPILSNFDNLTQKFDGAALNRILLSPQKREKFITAVIKVLEENNFAGVNIDFEELQQKTDKDFLDFQKELYERLHAKEFLVSQDIIPFNEDYDYKQLARYNDYVFIMAYDQFSNETAPGPICDQHWVEAAVDEAARKIPSTQKILCLAGYGYDWPKGSEAETITYQKALTIAKENKASIDFDNDNYNLNFAYTDDNNVAHKVFFTDAATAFNSLRFATESELSGVALWRLGSEDSRIWDFYNLDLSQDAIRAFNFNEFTSVEAPDDVDYSGDGEVLDIVSTPTNGKITPELDSVNMLISEEIYESLPSMFIVQKYGKTDPKKLVLSFDDGPDPAYTKEILDILSREHVPAAFFLVGLNAENNIPLVKRIYREGHEIGNHTFTHPNIAEVSHKRAMLEMESTRLLIECITGHSTIMFRAPYNADSEPEKMEELIPVALARTKNYLDIGESIDPEDWEPGVSADTIVARTINRKNELTEARQGGNIILLHDAGGDDRKATVEALPRIIHYFKEHGYTFTTVADLLGKKRSDLMPAVPKGSGYYIIQLNNFLAEAGYWGGHILFSLFVVFIVLSLARILLLGILTAIQHKREKKKIFATNIAAPLVSIIVPAYNEEINAVTSIHNLLRADYPNFNLIFVDDGSADATYDKVHNVFKNHPQVKLFTKPNGGKASALNYGISQSTADFVVCIDADTKLQSDAISLLMRHFTTAPDNKAGRGEVGAVAGNVKVGNEINMLTRWQSIEYITSQNFDRKAFAVLNAITVVPGAIGAFRKKAIEEAGGFTTDTLAEDCDLTIRILKQGYIIENETGAIAMTEAPETLKMFLKQRFRWSFGVMQSFWKHRDTLFNSRYKWLGWIAMPNILLFQFIIPSIAPLADLFMIVGLLTGNGVKILLYYGIFMLVDAMVSFIAFCYEKEDYKKLAWLIPQRVIYRWLMYYVLYKSLRRAIKGELQHWGVLKRTGNVRELQPV